MFLLVHISYLQPFADVNKRTARLCANLPLVIENLVPLSFNDTERDDYLSAIIAIYELRDVGPMVDLYLHSYLRTCVAYDGTVKALGFDTVRIRYRPQRRALIRTIIVTQSVGLSMGHLVEAEVKKSIPKEDQEAFTEDLMEDLEQIDASRIAGLGISLDELQAWLKLSLA